MNRGILVKLIRSRSTRQWWHWEGHRFKGQGQGQSEMATEILWTRQTMHHWRQMSF